MTAHEDEALAILAAVPLIDGHNDWPHLIRGFYDNQLDGRFDADKDLVGHVDVKRLRQGRSGGAFWSVYIDCPPSADGGPPSDDDAAHFEILRDTLQQIDLVHRLVHRYRDHMGLVAYAADITALFRAGRFASLIGVEGLHQIANSPSVLRLYHRLGVRYVTLAHSKSNRYADSATAAPRHDGLSTEGREMVREMNRIGMIIDLSHTSEAVMHQVLALSTAPVLFSHSSAASLVPHPRNVSDAVLAKLCGNNGVIMISFIPSLTAAEGPNLDRIVDHILHVASQIGYDHIGLGSDFDGMFRAVNGIDDVSRYPCLVEKMLQRGISADNVKKIIGLNVIRVLADVEKASQASQAPILGEAVKQLWDGSFREMVKTAYPQGQPDIPRK